MWRIEGLKWKYSRQIEVAHTCTCMKRFMTSRSLDNRMMISEKTCDYLIQRLPYETSTDAVICCFVKFDGCSDEGQSHQAERDAFCLFQHQNKHLPGYLFPLSNKHPHLVFQQSLLNFLTGGDATGWGFRVVDGATSPTGAFLLDVSGRQRRQSGGERSGPSCGDHTEFQRRAPGAQEDQRPPSPARSPRAERREAGTAAEDWFYPQLIDKQRGNTGREPGSQPKWPSHRSPASPVEKIRSWAGWVFEMSWF